MSKEPPVKTKNLPTIKLTKASVVSYSPSVPCKHQAELQLKPKKGNNKNSQLCNIKSCLKPSSAIPDCCDDDVEEFQIRVGTLRKKLDEANSNICTLKAFVVNTLEQINNKGKAKSPIETAEEIKNLLVILEEIEGQNNVVMKRGVECIQVVEELESSGCKCGPATPSVEAIRNELIEISEEQQIIDKKIAKEKGETVTKVHASCSIILCPRKPTDSVATGTQLCCPGPESKPKILQTDTKLNINVGTGPTKLTTSSKGQCAKVRCSCPRSCTSHCCSN